MLTKQDLENLIPSFLQFLAENRSSRSTILNYSSDLKRIIAVLPANLPLIKANFDEALISLGQTFSASSIRRFSFSAKAFSAWLISKGYKLEKELVNPDVAAKPQTISNPSKSEVVNNYTSNLSEQGSAANSIRSQKADVLNFFRWFRPNLTQIDKATTDLVNPSDIKRYISFLRFRGIPESSINRYLYSLTTFFNFAREKVVFETNPVIPTLNTKKDKERKWWQRFKLVKPKWWHAYRGHPLSDYINWAALAVITLLIGLGIFQQLFVPKQEKIDLAEIQKGLVLAATPPRVLSFQGRLTNPGGTPITGATNVVFKIYTVRTGGSPTWTSKTWSVTPDQNGIFSVCLGGQDTSDDCLIDGNADTVIPASLFSDNAALYLGITIGADSEATPRQRIASSSYALNSDSLDGIDSASFLRSDTSDNFTSGTLTLDDGTTFTANASTINLGNATGDALAVNATSTFNTDINLTFAGTENVAMTSDLAGTVDLVSIVGTPSGTSGTTQGLFIQQANSANSNGLDVGIKIDNADTNLALTDAINIGNSGGGGFTNYINATNFVVSGAGVISGADLTLGLNDSSATITTQDTDENLTIDPNGTGTIFFHGATYGITSTGALTVASCTGCGGGSFTLTGTESDTDQTISPGDTLTLTGGIGIDTSAANTDNLNIVFDSTEIGDTTWGSGSGFTWTFNASAGTDTTIAFGDNLQTFTTATATFSGNVNVNGGNIDSTTSLLLGSAGTGTITLPSSGDDIALAGDLDISGHAAIGGSASLTSTSILRTTETFNDTASLQGFLNTPTLNLSADYTTTAQGFNNTMTVTGTGNQTTSRIIGGTNIINFNAAGTSVNIAGLENVVSFGSSSGNATTARATYSRIDSSSSSGTITTANIYEAANSLGTGAITTLRGLYIPALTRGGTDNIGIQIDTPSGGSGRNAALVFSGTGGTAASGILFGTDTTLYRSNANELRTNDSLVVDIDLTVTGNDITFGNGESISNGTDNQIDINLGSSGTLLLTSSTASTIANSAGNLNINPVGSLVFSDLITDANAVLYTSTTGVVTRVTETETANQCLLSGSGTSGVPSWGTCTATGSFTITGTETDTDQTISSGDTLTLTGGTGIDTSAANTDNVNIVFDSTEIGSTTWNAGGSDPVWTFNTSGATDPTLTFANNQITIGSAATLTATAVTTLNCTDCINWDDIVDATTLDASTSIAFGAGSLNLTFTNDGSGNEIHNLSSTGDFIIQDNGNSLVSVSDSSVISLFPSNATAAGGNVLIDGATTDSTLNSTSTGVFGLTVDASISAASATNYGFYLDYQAVDDSDSTDTFIAQRLDITGSSVDNDTVYGLSINNVNDASGAATDALITLENNDANTAVGDAILFRAGGANAPDFTNGINFDAADFTTEIVLENAETIDNQTDNQINLGLGSSGTLRLTSSTTATITNSAGDLTLNPNGNLIVGSSTTELRLNNDYPRLGYWGGDANLPAWVGDANDGLRYNQSLDRFEFHPGNTLSATLDATTFAVTNVTADALIKGADLTLGFNDTSATISTNDTDENLTIDPNGTGTIFFHGATYGITSAGALTVASCTGCGGGSFTLTGTESDTDQTISAGDTLTLTGGTGIDTSAANTDNLNIVFDSTEIGNTTWGNGSGTTWTFDASAGTDTTIAFGNNTQTFTTGTATFTGDTTVNGIIRGGVNDNTAGILELLGAGTGTGEGAELRLYLSADYDTTFESWTMDVLNDDLRFFRSDGVGGTLLGLSDAGTLSLGTYTTDANAVLYTTTSGVVTRVAETETGSQCLLSGAGASGVPTWGSCPGGSSLFTDGGSFTYLTATTDDFLLGGSTVAAGSLFFDVSAGSLALGTNESLNGSITLYSSGAGITDPTISTDAAGSLILDGPAGDIVFEMGASERSYFDAVTTDSTLSSATSGSLTLAVDANPSSSGSNNGFYLDYQTVDDANANQTFRAFRLDLTGSSVDNDTVYGLSLNNANDASGAATDALITLENNDANTAVGDAILFLAGGANAPDFTNGINFDAADFTTEIVLENGETIDNQTNNQINLGLGSSGTLLLTSSTASTIANSAGTLNINPAGGTLASNATTVNFSSAALTVSSCTGCSSNTLWNNIGTPTGSLSLTFDDAEVNTFTVNSDTESFWSYTANSLNTGNILNLSSTGTLTTGGELISATANNATTGRLLDLSATGLTTGQAINLAMGTALTTGSALSISGASYTHSGVQTGSLVSLSFTDATSSGTPTTNGLLINSTLATSTASSTINGLKLTGTFTSCATVACAYNAALAEFGFTVTNSTTSAYLFAGFKAQGGSSLTQNTAAGSISWRGFETQTPAMTQTTGTVNAYGLYVTTGSITTNGTQTGIRLNLSSSISTNGTVYGLDIATTGSSVGAITGVNIGNLTSAGAATEKALVIGTGWDTGLEVNSGGITIAGGTLTYSSSNRPARKLVIAPEYPGATLFGDGSNNTGTMTSDYTNSTTGDRQNFYEWNSATASPLQDYTVVVRFTLPDNFGAWATSNAMVFDFVTETTSSSNQQIDISVFLESGASADATSNDNVSGVAATWTTTSIDDSVLGECDAAGETCVIEFSVQSLNNNYVRIGDITLNYGANF